MSRPKEFNERQILESAMVQFWRFGYASTSLADLEKATGIGKKSLYNSVGDKKAIFLRTIELFTAFAGQEYISLMEKTDSDYKDIEKTMKKMLKARKSDLGGSGCFVCNTSREEIRSDEDVDKKVTSYLERVEAAFLNAINNQLKEKDRKKSIHLSKWMFGVFFSACSMASASVEYAIIQSFIEESLDHLKTQIVVKN